MCPKRQMSKVPRPRFIFAIDNGDRLQDNHWILDSGSSRHLVNDLSLLVNPSDCRNEFLTAATDGGVLRITKQGSVNIEVLALGVVNTIRLLDVQYSANLERNIISYGTLEAKVCVLEYRGGKRVLTSGFGGAPIMDVDCSNNVLVVAVTGPCNKTSHLPPREMTAAINSPEYNSDSDVQSGTLMQFHRRLGHLCYDTIIKVAKDPASGIGLTDTRRMSCLACAQGKQTKASQSRKDSGQNSPIDVIGGVICSDLKGPMTPRDRLGNRYLVNFIDHRSNYCRVFLARSKDVAALKFKHFLMSFEREFNCNIHVLRTDEGGEYKTLDVFCKTNGVSRQVSKARNQASNGKAERMHRTIMNMVRSMVFASNLPLHFWGDAAEYATYILNRSRTKSNPGGVSPMEFLTTKVPNLNDIVAFGSTCTVHVDARNKSLGERGKAAIIIGKSDETKGYKVYIPKDKVVVVTQHVRNIETLSDGRNGQDYSYTERIKHQEEISTDDQQKVQVPSSVKKRAAKARSGRKPGWTRERHGTRSTSRRAKKVVGEGPAERQDVVNAVIAQDPKHYGEAMRSGDRQKWTTAMTEELDALKSNGVWTIVLPPKGAHFLHNKWVYKTKTDANGGRGEVQGSPGGLWERASVWRWNVPARHGDVPNAYVKAEKEEHLDIYMKVPKGMVLSDQELKLHGVETSSDLYKGETCTVVGVYVDDLLVTGTEQGAVDEFFMEMSSLSIKDLGVVNKFLGLRINLNDETGYVLDQEVMIDLLLKEFGLDSANGVRTPIGDECNAEDEDTVEYLSAKGTKGEPSVKSFQSLVGSLLWIARCTRPDICFAVHKATRQTHKPTTKDWKVAKSIARYLKMSKGLKLHLNGVGPTSNDVQVECWSDADFAADKSDRKSVSGCVLNLDGAVVMWTCKKQSGVSLSTMEAELISASQAGRELLGLRELLGELKLKISEPMPMWVDNQAAIKQLESEKSTSSAKHVDIRFKFILHHVREGVVQPKLIKSEDMMADILTKTLPAPRMEDLRAMFKLKSIQDAVEEEC
ncbi:unnamed protein product [Peronospora effusa]|nr:unnamed protein product [Peronospora effusa]